jgi:SulP family sulfate permease
MTASGGGATRSFSRLDRPVAVVTAGLICGFLAIVVSIGHGTLLFQGDLRPYIPVSIGLALFSTAIVAAGAAIANSTRGAVAITQDIPVVALAGMMTVVAGHMGAGADDHARLVTLVVAAALGTATTGIVAIALGHFRLGNLVRFAPYPVIGGFLAGTGWLILTGGLGLIVGQSLDITHLAPLADPAAYPKIAAAAALVAVLVLVQVRMPGSFGLPATILLSLVAFHAVAAAAGVGAERLRADGWLLELPRSGALWPPFSLADLSHVDWSAVLAGAVGIPVVVVLTIMAILMNATGIELDSEQDIDLDRELRATGAMNLVAATGAGLPGYPTVALTLLATRLNAANRWVGLIVCGMTVVAMAFGGFLFDFVPATVLGGVLVWIGGTLLHHWLVRSYARLGTWEYLVIVAIFLTIAGVGFLSGMIVGLAAAIVLFAVQYGRIDVVRHEMLGTDYQSSVESSEHRRERLLHRGTSILIVRLQGFLFFGTADRLRRRIQERIAASAPTPHPFVLIDFRRVTGLDSSTVFSLVRLGQVAARSGVTIVLTQVPERAAIEMHRGGLNAGSELPFRFEADFERGLKWCEDQLLAGGEPRDNAPPRLLADLINEIVRDGAAADRIASYCQRIEAESGTRLIEQGARSEDIFFIESGNAAVELTTGDGESVRLTTVGNGAVVGEVAFYTGEVRTAAVVVEEPVVAWRFTRDSLRRMEVAAPEAAHRFHEGMAALLGRRLTRTNRLVRFLAN